MGRVGKLYQESSAEAMGRFSLPAWAQEVAVRASSSLLRGQKEGKALRFLKYSHEHWRGQSAWHICIALMRRGMYSVIFLIGVHSLGWGQETRAERLKSLRIALITEALELTPEEAQVFWPVYNAREAALQKHREEIHARFMRLRAEKTTLSPQAYADSVSGLYFQLWEGEAAIRKAYHDRLLKVLPAQKVAKLYVTEMRMLRRALGQEGMPPRRP